MRLMTKSLLILCMVFTAFASFGATDASKSVFEYHCEANGTVCFQTGADGVATQVPVSSLPAAVRTQLTTGEVGGSTEARRIYRCYPGYDPARCELVYEGANQPGGTIAAAAAVSLTQRTAAFPADGPITQCGAGKGQSACCKIIGHMDDGSKIIECGVAAAPTDKPVADSLYQCRRDIDGITRCTCIRACPISDSLSNLASALVSGGAATQGCGGGHGQTACCRIVTGETGGGSVFVECGQRSMPTSGPIANFFNEAGTKQCPAVVGPNPPRGCPTQRPR